MMSNVQIEAFNARMASALQKVDVPSLVHLDITYRCDLDCEHCYLDNKQTWPELRRKEIVGLLDELYAMGVPTLCWSGGEPFARPDFFGLLEHAASRGFVSIVKTHAGNVTQEVAERLVSLGVARVDVSLYSLDDELHDAVTRVPGSLTATLAGVRNLVAAGIRVRATSVTLPNNIHELHDLRHYAENIGCDYQSSSFIHLDHQADDGLDVLNLDEQALRVALRQDFQAVRGRTQAPPRLNPDGNPCGAGRTSAYVTPDGAVWPCVAFPMPLGHIREGSFQEIWKGSQARHELASWTNKDRTDCLSCAGSGTCFYCAGDAYKRTGDFRTAPDVFHWRARVGMKAYEDITEYRFTEQEWDSVPQGAPEISQVEPPKPKKFHFPIYRPGQRPNRTESLHSES